jgi:hypothetical protein
MCSVSFVPGGGGFFLAMNRDEQRARPPGLPPRVQAGGRLLYPSEPGGGTWIGVNTEGLALALINWYAQTYDPGVRAASRGCLIPHLLESSSFSALERSWGELELRCFRPFRLLAFSREDRVVREWRWDGGSGGFVDFSWEPGHWFSSGHDEPAAQAVRQRVAEAAWRKPGAGSLSWLRALHASHRPEQGAFSFCMHRTDACTVSYTELAVGGENARMAYRDGSPCGRGSWTEKNLDFEAGKVF